MEAATPKSCINLTNGNPCSDTQISSMLWHKAEFYPTSPWNVEDTNLVFISLSKVKMGEGTLKTPLKKTKYPYALPTATITSHPDSNHFLTPREKHEKGLQGHKTTDCSESPVLLEGTPLLTWGFTTQCPLEYIRNLRCLHEDMAECDSPFEKTAPCQS